MQTATCFIVIDRLGSGVFRPNVTPAEATILQAMHTPYVGGNPVTQINLTGDATVVTERDEKRQPTAFRERTQADEIARLRRKYSHFQIKGQSVVEKLYPGLNPKLAETFEEAGFSEDVVWGGPERETTPTLKGNAVTDEDFLMLAQPNP